MANMPKKCFNGLAVSGATGDRQSRGSSVPVTFKKSAKKSAGISVLLVVLACLGAAVLVGHQTVPPMDRDESRFAQASKQMVQTGDLVTIRFQDDIRAKKPAGIYWLQAASASLFGDSNIAAYRLPSLLAMLLTVYGTYRMARTLYKPHRAVLAAAACGTALTVLAEAHLAKTDSVLMLLCLIQQYGLMRIYQAWQHGRRLSYHSYLWVWLPMAAAVLVKGPVAPLLALTTVAALSAWHRNVTWLRMLRFGRGVLILCLVTLPWAVLVTLATCWQLSVAGDVSSLAGQPVAATCHQPDAAAIVACRKPVPAGLDTALLGADRIRANETAALSVAGCAGDYGACCLCR